MIKRIILMLIVAAMMTVTMMVSAPAAFATNTCKDGFSGPPPGQQTCEKGSTTVTKHGNSDNQTCVKKGDRFRC